MSPEKLMNCPPSGGYYVRKYHITAVACWIMSPTVVISRGGRIVLR